MIDSHYITDAREIDPNTPKCEVCGAVMVRFDSFGKWVCMSCGEVIEPFLNPRIHEGQPDKKGR
jgi:ribosomal protein L37AE/L43A